MTIIKETLQYKDIISGSSIKKMMVGQQYPCRIIAELGTLHHHQGIGGLETATRDAFNAGADAVKIQLIDPSKAWWANHYQITRYQRLLKAFPKEDWLEYLRRMNKEHEQPIFASVFDADTYDYVKEAMPAVKLAFIARTRQDLFNHVLQNLPFDQTAIISLGEDRLSKRILQTRLNPARTKLLYIQSEYPLLDCNARLPIFGHVWDGLSVHSRNFKLLAGAIALGCQMIEVHAKGTDASGVDVKFAMDFSQIEKLRKMCEGFHSIFSLAVNEIEK